INGQGGIAGDANGNFVVAWDDGGGHVQRYSNTGKKVGSEIAVGGGSNVGRDADGDFVVTWGSAAQVFNNNGAPRGGVIATGVGESIAVQANGDFVLSWTQGGDVYAQRFDLNGVAKETAHRVNVTVAGSQEHASVAVASNGNYVVVWNTPFYRSNGPNPDILQDCDVQARRFEVGAALMAASEASGNSADAITTGTAFDAVLAEAIARWTATGLTGARLALLDRVNVQIANLGGATLGLAAGNTIWLDDNAAGWGWFVDPTPSDDSEFLLKGDQGEQGRMDLLTALAHEIGHLLGYDHDDGGTMAETL